VADVVLGGQQRRREVGLEVRQAAKAGFIELVFVAVEQAASGSRSSACASAASACGASMSSWSTARPVAAGAARIVAVPTMPVFVV
jgi:hypothetical protein